MIELSLYKKQLRKEIAKRQQSASWCKLPVNRIEQRVVSILAALHHVDNTVPGEVELPPPVHVQFFLSGWMLAVHYSDRVGVFSTSEEVHLATRRNIIKLGLAKSCNYQRLKKDILRALDV